MNNKQIRKAMHKRAREILDMNLGISDSIPEDSKFLATELILIYKDGIIEGLARAKKILK